MENIWSDSVFFEVLLAIDRGMALEKQGKGCPLCGDKLDVSNYPRKARGVVESEPFDLRLSFCCRREGCRRRTTPQSVRFLGRKVYVGVVVILASFRAAVCVGLELCRRTVSRWMKYWADVFDLRSPFWKSRRAMFSPGFDAGQTPGAVVHFFEAQHKVLEEAAKKYLQFFSPLSISIISP